MYKNPKDVNIYQICQYKLSIGQYKSSIGQYLRGHSLKRIFRLVFHKIKVNSVFAVRIHKCKNVDQYRCICQKLILLPLIRIQVYILVILYISCILHSISLQIVQYSGLIEQYLGYHLTLRGCLDENL